MVGPGVAQGQGRCRDLQGLAALRARGGSAAGASYGCRVGVNVVFMAAFGIPITAYTVFLVAASHTLSQLFAITPGGVGQTQALDVATLRSYSSSSNVTAFSVTQDAVITIWNVVLGVAVLLWAFGWRQARQMLSRSRRKQAQEPAAEAAPTAPSEP
jgi:uncharacterized membrane protein YbhN (UPF0104 family)